MSHAINVEDGKIVREAVVAQMVAERALRQAAVRVDRAGDHEVSLGGKRQLPLGADHPQRSATQCSGEDQLGEAFRERHDRRHRQRRRSAHEHVDAERHPLANRRRVMHADAAVDLVVQADFAERVVTVSRKLHAVHAEVGLAEAGAVGVFRVDLRQRHERAAVHRPAFELRQFVEAAFSAGDRSGSDFANPQIEQRERHVSIPPRIARERHGVDLEFDKMPHSGERVAKEEPRAVQGAEQVRHHRETASLGAREQQRRSPGEVHAALDLGHFQAGVDLVVDHHELTGGAKVVHAFAKVAVAHGGGRGGRDGMWN
jgi:hypothetical protein